MAIEARRGCGCRRVGGLYLVTFGQGRHCGKMPLTWPHPTMGISCGPRDNRLPKRRPHRGIGVVGP
jgi:hypothetical protein